MSDVIEEMGCLLSIWRENGSRQAADMIDVVNRTEPMHHGVTVRSRSFSALIESSLIAKDSIEFGMHVAAHGHGW